MMLPVSLFLLFFFFNDTATTEIYTLSLHDALPIYRRPVRRRRRRAVRRLSDLPGAPRGAHLGARAPSRPRGSARSEEHTSELQSRLHLVCRLLLEKKKIHRDHIALYLVAMHTTSTV